jgi:hypothetical protein
METDRTHVFETQNSDGVGVVAAINLGTDEDDGSVGCEMDQLRVPLKKVSISLSGLEDGMEIP